MNIVSGFKPASAVASLLLPVGALLAPTAWAAVEQEWQFRVYLDDRPIGYHAFRVTRDGQHKHIRSRADFDVTFFKIPFFKYRHENNEHWKNQCLTSISSETDQNGENFSVTGTAGEQGFRLVSNQGDTTLPPCVSTFAYWDRSFLRNDRLLNSQTGEYLEVNVDSLGKQSIRVYDTDITANHYRLTAEALDIDLWYSAAGQWLGLQSTTSKGRVLRYVME
jgi:hypothetical protein